MPIKEFIIKTFAVTFCIYIFLNLSSPMFSFYPRYEYINEKTRFDKVQGKIEHRSSWSWSEGY